MRHKRKRADIFIDAAQVSIRVHPLMAGEPLAGYIRMGHLWTGVGPPSIRCRIEVMPVDRRPYSMEMYFAAWRCILMDGYRMAFCRSSEEDDWHHGTL